MRDNQLEDRVRAVLRAEGDVLPLTITPEELDRRLALRRRERFARRISLVAAGIGVIALGSALALSSGWLRQPAVGSGPSAAPNVDTGMSQGTAVPIPSEPGGPCETIDPAALDEPPRLLMGTSPGGGTAISGQRSSYRLGDRQVGDEGTWDHDTIGMESVVAGFPDVRLQVLSSNPDACFVGLRVDALPEQDPNLESTRIAEHSFDPTRVVDFDKPSVGDWFLRVHADFATIPGTTAWAEAFFVVEVADCVQIDPATLGAPPSVGAGVADGNAVGIDGIQTAFEWGDRRVGSVGSWDSMISDIAPIRVRSTFQAMRLVSDACMFDFSAEVWRIDETGRAEAEKAPVHLPAIRGAGTKAIDIGGPPVGDWALLVHVSFLTSDGLPAWSETLFRVESLFDPPGLAIGPEFFEVMAEAACPSYDLSTGARGANECTAGYQLMDGREPVPVSPGVPLRFRLTDDWSIDEARVIAVDADLVRGGFFAPEYSVSFQEQVGDALSFPIELDQGSWILRISLNGNRQGDTFDAHYDIAITVTR